MEFNPNVSTPDSSKTGASVSSSERKSAKRRSRGKQCAAFGCYNYQYNDDGTSSTVSFFQFPLEEPLKSKFCKLIKRVDGKDGFKVSSQTKICSYHFEEKDIAGGMSRKTLKPDALPSRFFWTEESKSRPAPRQRLFDDSHSKRKSSSKKEKPKQCSVEVQTDISFVDQPKFLQPHSDHQYASSSSFEDHPFRVIASNEALREKISSLEKQNAQLVSSLADLRLVVAKLEERIFSVQNILVGDDDAVQFYTGFTSYDVFCTVFEYFKPAFEKAHYWRGKESTQKETYMHQKEVNKKCGPKRKVELVDKFF